MNLSKKYKNNKTFRFSVIALIVVGAYLYQTYFEHSTAEFSGSEFEYVIANQLSDAQAEDTGRVVNVLPDDTRGSQHPRFLVKLENNHVILTAHNIDCAPCVAGLQDGDEVSFYGEFEWHQKGRVVHWTHHDPKNSPHGWIELNGKHYQ